MTQFYCCCMSYSVHNGLFPYFRSLSLCLHFHQSQLDSSLYHLRESECHHDESSPFVVLKPPGIKTGTCSEKHREWKERSDRRRGGRWGGREEADEEEESIWQALPFSLWLLERENGKLHNLDSNSPWPALHTMNSDSNLLAHAESQLHCAVGRGPFESRFSVLIFGSCNTLLGGCSFLCCTYHCEGERTIAQSRLPSHAGPPKMNFPSISFFSSREGGGGARVSIGDNLSTLLLLAWLHAMTF